MKYPAKHAKRIHYFRKVVPHSLKTISFTCVIVLQLASGSGPRGCNLNLEGVQLRLLGSLLGSAVGPSLTRRLGL